jgi:hypothetical protein
MYRLRFAFVTAERKTDMIRALAAETPELPRINTLFLDQYLRRRPTLHNRISLKEHEAST